MPRRLLPGDESSHGFDNVTVGDLSPTLLDRYITAAQKISRLAVGSPGRSPGGETIRIRADLTQEEHVDGLPLGTRGGALIPYTFPQDGEYEIQLRLARDRNEHVEGLREPHELEVLLDRERMALFTVTPPRRRGPSDRRREAEGPHPGDGRSAQIGVTFLKKPSSLLETKRQPYQAHFNLHRHPRIIAGDLPGLDHRPVSTPRGTGTRPAAAGSSSASRRGRARRKPVPGASSPR